MSDQQLLFAVRGDFRDWLEVNATTSEGVWLVFDKTGKKLTLTADQALEEALCFGWIDSQMKSIDDNRYIKYFSRRRSKSIWSEKNKKKIELLRTNGLMTELGEQAVQIAQQNGMWDRPSSNAITEQQIEEFSDRLKEYSPAYENFVNMSFSVRRTYTARYLSFKTEQARERDFTKIVQRLNNNLKPM
ncbi:MAG: YdeI/OmpD-associated family protein [Oscillospiraceae bacterium]|nr:YdeI/OmpD-associated family protein [Oscillospiraceae bacterium]